MLQKIVLPAVLIMIVMTLLTGVVYPLVVTGVAHLAFPRQAEGSLIEVDGQRVCSALVGQPFDDPKYFWSRPSATTPVAYKADASTGSNLGPTDPALRAAIEARIEALKSADPDNDKPIPVDLVTASGSGLDPHISPAAAEYQVERVARARGTDAITVRQIVADHREPRALGLFGEGRVNVVKLNLALDHRKP